MLDTDKLKAALAYGGATQKKIAQEIGMTAANFNNKVLRSTFTDEEMFKIVRALGAEYIPVSLVFPDRQKFQ